MAGLPTFWPITFHLFASYSRMAASRATLFDGQPGESEKAAGGHGYLVFAKLGIVHVLRGPSARRTNGGRTRVPATHLIPMLLDGALGPGGESLCNLAPRVACVAHALEPLLLGGRPGRVGAWALGGGGRCGCRRSRSRTGCGACTACCCSSARRAGAGGGQRLAFPGGWGGRGGAKDILFGGQVRAGQLAGFLVGAGVGGLGGRRGGRGDGLLLLRLLLLLLLRQRLLLLGLLRLLLLLLLLGLLLGLRLVVVLDGGLDGPSRHGRAVRRQRGEELVREVLLG